MIVTLVLFVGFARVTSTEGSVVMRVLLGLAGGIKLLRYMRFAYVSATSRERDRSGLLVVMRRGSFIFEGYRYCVPVEWNGGRRLRCVAKGPPTLHTRNCI
jgi:hypothetical protein